MNKISGAKRLAGFDKPTVWSMMTPLAIRTNSINLVIIALYRVKDFLHGSHQNSIRISFKNLFKDVPNVS